MFFLSVDLLGGDGRILLVKVVDKHPFVLVAWETNRKGIVRKVGAFRWGLMERGTRQAMKSL